MKSFTAKNDPLVAAAALVLTPVASVNEAVELAEETKTYRIFARFNNKNAKGIWQKINWSTEAASKEEAEAKFRKRMGKDIIKDLEITESTVEEVTELDEGIVDFKGASNDEIKAIIDKLKAKGHRPEWEDTTRLSTKNSSTQAALKKELKIFMSYKNESVAEEDVIEETDLNEAPVPMPETPVELLRKGSKTGFRAGVTDRIFAATFRQLGDDEEIARRAVDSFLNALARLEPSKKLIEGIAKAFD